MRPLLILLLWLCLWPVNAGLLESRPSSVLGAPLNNSTDFLPVREAFRLSLTAVEGDQLKLRFVIAEGYYLYRHRLQFASKNPAIVVEVVDLPEGEKKVDDYFGEVSSFRGVLDVVLRVRAPLPDTFELRVGYQGCADRGLCYPPETDTLAIRFPSVASSASSSAVTAPEEGLWQSIGLFFLAGLGLTFTPCVLPMLPILSGVVLRGQPGSRRSLALSLAYVLPMALCFAVLGILTGLFGAELNIQARLQSPWVLVPFAGLFALLSLAMFGVFELRLPHRVVEQLNRFAQRAGGGSLGGAVLLGILSSLLVSPCVSAPLAGALLYISSSGDALGGGLRLFALGLGMGLPLVVLACGGGALLPKTGAWMLGVRNCFGVLLLAVALWLLDRVLPGSLMLLLWGVLAAGCALFLGALERIKTRSSAQKLSQLAGLLLLVYALSCWIGAFQGHVDPLRPLATQPSISVGLSKPEQGLPWQHLDSAVALEQNLAAAARAGQPLLLDWYADWCISCKVMEREVLAHPDVRARLGRYQLLRMDVTQNTPEQRQIMDRFKVFGPPAILFFNQRGEEIVAARIIGETDVAHFAQQLDALEQQGVSPAKASPSPAITL